MLNKIKSFLKGRKLILTLVIIVLATSLVYGSLSKKDKSEKPGETGPKKESLISTSEGVTVGKSKAKDLDAFGEPREIKENPDNTMSYVYGLETDPQPTKVVVKDEKIIFIKKRPTLFDPTSLSSFKDQLGEPDFSLYHEYPTYKAFVFLEEGVAVIAGEEKEEVIELRYFVPMKREEFLLTWGKDLLPQPPPLPPLYY